MKRANKFECDKSKGRSNFEKHGIRFSEGCRIFDGHTLTSPSKQNADLNEERYVSIGSLNSTTAVVVVWTRRLDNMRVISVRKARRDERDRFHAHIQKAIN